MQEETASGTGSLDSNPTVLRGGASKLSPGNTKGQLALSFLTEQPTAYPTVVLGVNVQQGIAPVVLEEELFGREQRLAAQALTM